MCTACVWTHASTCHALALITRTLQEEIDQFLSEQQDEEDDADDDFEPEPAPKKARQERGPAPTAPAGDCVVPLSAKRFASVRSFGGRLMADVREFYEKEGQLQVGAAAAAGPFIVQWLLQGSSMCCGLRLLLCLLGRCHALRNLPAVTFVSGCSHVSTCCASSTRPAARQQGPGAAGGGLGSPDCRHAAAERGAGGARRERVCGSGLQQACLGVWLQG